MQRGDIQYLAREDAELNSKSKINESKIYFLWYFLIMSLVMLLVNEQAIYLLVYLIESTIVLFGFALFYDKVFHHNNPFQIALMTVVVIWIVVFAIIRTPNTAWRMNVYNDYIIFMATIESTNRDVARVVYPIIQPIQQVSNMMAQHVQEVKGIFDTQQKEQFKNDGMFVRPTESSVEDTTQNTNCEAVKISIKNDTTFSGVQCIDSCEYKVEDVNQKSENLFVLRLIYNNNFCTGEK